MRENHQSRELRTRLATHPDMEWLLVAKAAVEDYFAGRPMREQAIDWPAVSDAPTLRAAAAATARSAQTISYGQLDTDTSPEQRGRALVPTHLPSSFRATA